MRNFLKFLSVVGLASAAWTVLFAVIGLSIGLQASPVELALVGSMLGSCMAFSGLCAVLARVPGARS